MLKSTSQPFLHGCNTAGGAFVESDVPLMPTLQQPSHPRKSEPGRLAGRTIMKWSGRSACSMMTRPRLSKRRTKLSSGYFCIWHITIVYKNQPHRTAAPLASRNCRRFFAEGLYILKLRREVPTRACLFQTPRRAMRITPLQLLDCRLDHIINVTLRLDPSRHGDADQLHRR